MTAELVSHQNAYANRICTLNDSESDKRFNEYLKLERSSFRATALSLEERQLVKYARIMIQLNSLRIRRWF